MGAEHVEVVGAFAPLFSNAERGIVVILTQHPVQRIL